VDAADGRGMNARFSFIMVTENTRMGLFWAVFICYPYIYLFLMS
jgi:hypothetical protein